MQTIDIMYVDDYTRYAASQKTPVMRSMAQLESLIWYATTDEDMNRDLRDAQRENKSTTSV